MANPNTCLHRVIEIDMDYSAPVYQCSSCQSLLPKDFWEGRVFKYLPEHHRWEQVGPTARPSLRKQAEHRREIDNRNASLFTWEHDCPTSGSRESMPLAKGRCGACGAEYLSPEEVVDLVLRHSKFPPKQEHSPAFTEIIGRSREIIEDERNARELQIIQDINQRWNKHYGGGMEWPQARTDSGH